MEQQQKQRKQQQEKRKRLMQKLDRLKSNSDQLMQRMDTKITAMNDLKNDLNTKSQKMSECVQFLQNKLIMSANEMLGVIKIERVITQNCILKNAEVSFIVQQKLLKAKKVCILTGAGVSKNSGIPTFRGDDGLYKNSFIIPKMEQGKQVNIEMSPEQFLTTKTFFQYPQQIWHWCKKMENLIKMKKPQKQHQLIHKICQDLLKRNIQTHLVTTNLDSFHNKLAIQNKEKEKYFLHQIHGHFRQYLCKKCKFAFPATQSITNFKCYNCQSTEMRPYMMFFDQEYNQVFVKNQNIKQRFDVVIAVGTSLQTGFSERIVAKSGCTIEINPKCVIDSKKAQDVFHFQNECAETLNDICSEIQNF